MATRVDLSHFCLHS